MSEAPIHFDVAGKRFEVAANLDELSAIVRLAYARQNWKFLRGCERCKVACTETKLCYCCATSHRTPRADDGMHHVTLMPVDDFLSRAEKHLARGAA